MTDQASAEELGSSHLRAPLVADKCLNGAGRQRAYTRLW